MAFTKEGKRLIITNYLTVNNFYLGLWTSDAGITIKNTLTLDDMANIEVVKNEYKRIEILPEDWIYTTAKVSSPTLTFSPKVQNWDNIAGYFLSTTLDNSGDLFLSVTYDTPENVPALSEHSIVIDIGY